MAEDHTGINMRMRALLNMWHGHLAHAPQEHLPAGRHGLAPGNSRSKGNSNHGQDAHATKGRLTCGVLLALLLSLIVAMAGCKRPISAVDDPRAAAVDEQVREKWGKGLAELETVKLVAIAAHNDDITNEFEWAFTLWHAVEFGQKVDIEWLDVGGGGSAIEQFIRNSYENSKTGGIDVDIVWGGGDILFHGLADDGMLTKLDLSDDVRAALSADFGGLARIDPDSRWVGTAISGFGFIYNSRRLGELGIDAPRKWEDLGAPNMFSQLCLADPTQSSSALAAYEMIVQSGDDWPDGWAKLMGILSNASRIVDNASHAANAPVEGTAVVATAIDFYGINRVAEHPDVLAFVLPAEQTAFTPDPIGILRNPPNAELAQHFVDFVMSPQGQAMLALAPGSEDGPIRHLLGRRPIRHDVYSTYADTLPENVDNPYEGGADMTLDMEIRYVRQAVLGWLVKAAAVDNYDGMRAAKQELIDTGFEPDRLAEFNRLPDNVLTVEQIRQAGQMLRGDEKLANELRAGWREFFREKYQRVAQ